MAENAITFEKDGPDDIVRVDGLLIGRLTGEGANRQMQWREGQDLAEEKLVAFARGFGESDRSTEAAERQLRASGLF